MPSTLLASSSVLVFLALRPSSGLFSWSALAGMTAAAGGALAAVWLGRRADATGHSRAARSILLAGLVLSLSTHLLETEGTWVAPHHHPWYRGLAWIAVALVLTSALPRLPRWVQQLRFPGMVACFLGMGAVLFLTTRRPEIDVWMFQQGAGTGLWHGLNPYELVFPNPYPDGRFYGPGVLVNGQVVVYPYPPLMALLDALAVAVAGDVRWMVLGTMALGAWLVRLLGDGPEAELAALLILFQPRGLHVAALAWTEPLVLAGFAAALAALVRWRAAPPRGWWGAGLAAALLLASKQYAPLLAWPLLLATPRAGRGRAVALALGLVAALTLPFLFWKPGEFWFDVVVCQLRQPFRLDSLSWLAAAARAGLGEGSTLIGVLLCGAVLVLGPGRAPRPLHAVACSGAALLLLLLFSKQAFCNYYWLAGGVLATGAALSPASSVAAPATAGSSAMARATA